MQLKEEHSIEQLWKDKNYIIWGMPFYNQAQRTTQFEQSFKKLYE